MPGFRSVAVATAFGFAGAWLTATPALRSGPGAPPRVPAATGLPAAPAPAWGSYEWPLRGPVLRGFEPPAGPYAPGHRGIDIGAPAGTLVRAPAAGRVAFAGPVAGGLFASIDHPDGVRTTYSWLSSLRVRRGDAVALGQPLGISGSGHPGSDRPHLHFGARVGELFLDPLLLLGEGSVVGLVRLAPLPPARGP